ncbi:MAG TPA: tetratricopeptide repeat protein [Candidatus Ozemobacteraceae bacterium]|nr:tetratricopeptide repeat protein [Candidatus Ozemobacteraceae bacterium]
MAALFLACTAMAQMSEDINEFLTAGKACYQKRDLLGAQTEFENVLLLDPRNLDAMVCLVRVYADRKELRKAQDMLSRARQVNSDHAAVKELTTLLGSDRGHVKAKEADLVTYEALTLLGSGTRQRPYGLVVPETRVKVAAKDPLADEAEKPLSLDPATTSPELQSFTKDEGPLTEVFDLWVSHGLPVALEKYFELILADRSIGAYDDRKLLEEGLTYFNPRLESNKEDPEARFFLGMIAYLNGMRDRTLELFEPLRANPGSHEPLVRKVLKELDDWKAEEERRLAEIKRQKEAEEAAKQAQLLAQQMAASNASAAAAVGSGTAGTSTSGSEMLDNDGYDLYKRGQIEAAIEKFTAAIKENANEPKFHYHLGLALTDKGLNGQVEAFDRAIEAFNQVLRLTPGSKLAQDSETMIRDIVAAKNTLKK